MLRLYWRGCDRRASSSPLNSKTWCPPLQGLMGRRTTVAFKVRTNKLRPAASRNSISGQRPPTNSGSCARSSRTRAITGCRGPIRCSRSVTCTQGQLVLTRAISMTRSHALKSRNSASHFPPAAIVPRSHDFGAPLAASRAEWLSESRGGKRSDPTEANMAISTKAATGQRLSAA